MTDKSSVLKCVTLVDETGKWTCSFSHNSDSKKAAKNHPSTPVFSQQENKGHQLQSNSCSLELALVEFMDYL